MYEERGHVTAIGSLDGHLKLKVQSAMKPSENVSIEMLSIFMAKSRDPNGRKDTFGDILCRIGLTIKEWHLVSKRHYQRLLQFTQKFREDFRTEHYRGLQEDFRK